MKTLLFAPPKYNGQFITVNDCCWGTGEVQVLQDRLLRTGSYLSKQGDEVGFLDAGMLGYNWVDVFRELKGARPDRLIFHVVPQFENWQTIVVDMCLPLGIEPVVIGITDFYEVALSEMYRVVPSFELGLPSWNEMPSIDFSLLRSHGNYIMNPVFQISEGCPYNCSFCVWGKKDFKMLPVDVLFENLKGYKENVPIYLLCAQITTNKTWLEKFVERKKEHNLDFRYITDIHPAEVTEDRIELLIESGCIKATMGVESTNQNVLDAINKNVRVNEIENAILICKNKGLDLTVPFMYNVLPNEDADKDIRFYKQYKSFEPSPGLLKIYPGTTYWDMAFDWEYVMGMGTNPTPTKPYLDNAIKCLKKWESVLDG